MDVTSVSKKDEKLSRTAAAIFVVTSEDIRRGQGLSLSVQGQNLLKDHHLEFIDSAGASRSTLINRSAYAKITWQP